MVYRLARVRTFVGFGLAMAVALLLTIGSAAAEAGSGSDDDGCPRGPTPLHCRGRRASATRRPARRRRSHSFLRAQNLGQLEASVTNGADRFLTVNQFASRYGQSPATIASLEGYLATFGIQDMRLRQQP